jgi:hypothetical protein
VRALTPSEVSAVLGWDEESAIRPVALTDEDIANWVPPEPVAPTGERRIRRVM